MQSIKLCENIVETKNTELFEVLKLAGDNIVYNHQLYVVLAMVCIVLLMTYLLRTSRINYSFEIGIVFGTVSSIVILFMGNLFLKCDFSICLL